MAIKLQNLLRREEEKKEITALVIPIPDMEKPFPKDLSEQMRLSVVGAVPEGFRPQIRQHFDRIEFKGKSVVFNTKGMSQTEIENLANQITEMGVPYKIQRG